MTWTVLWLGLLAAGWLVYRAEKKYNREIDNKDHE